MPTVTTSQVNSRPASPRLAKLTLLWLAVPFWVAAVAIGFFLLLDYKNAKGDSGAPPSQWPSEAPIPAPVNRPTLLVFSHPHCPCTRASFRELEQIIAQVSFRIDVRVIFVGAGDEPPLISAARLPLAEIYYNRGDLAHLFNVKTSGHVLLYNAHGQLRYSGGVTASRGHEGDSIGGAALTAWLRTGLGEITSAPVYGCPLFAPQNEAAAKCLLSSCSDASKGD